MDTKARFPGSNVEDVTAKALDEAPLGDKYEHIILSAPTVDITNLDTSQIKPEDNIDILKQEIVKSCKNMMRTAKKERFDIKATDPLSLKAEFAKYANNLYHQLWFESK